MIKKFKTYIKENTEEDLDPYCEEIWDDKNETFLNIINDIKIGVKTIEEIGDGPYLIRNQNFDFYCYVIPDGNGDGSARLISADKFLTDIDQEISKEEFDEIKRYAN